MRPLPHSLTRITRIHPPAPHRYDQHSIRNAPAHDPERARRVVRELSTVADVVEEVAPIARRDIGSPKNLGDLDIVTIGCWGNAIQITDPAFAENGTTTYNLDNAFDAQVQAHPDARIAAACEMDFSQTYAKYLIHVPGAPRVSADGWDETDVTGDLVEALRACGIDPSGPGTENLDYDDPDTFVWGDYLDLVACGLHIPFATESLQVSVFRVTRPEETRDDMEEAWQQD
ncbi:DUF6333 family protein [Streptomyces sp. NBC_00820]|uniref:DUF6333 family protein n=1 Tax=Streptomyces sp. NBC_00820 TaxID=2975842 RepID=UPI002ED24A7C|nr:DUF6333 family protein [Streptomyces sp. NBC_00820]